MRKQELWGLSIASSGMWKGRKRLLPHLQWKSGHRENSWLFCTHRRAEVGRQTTGPTSEERELTAGRDNLFSFYFVLCLFIYFLGCSTWHVGSCPPWPGIKPMLPALWKGGPWRDNVNRKCKHINNVFLYERYTWMPGSRLQSGWGLGVKWQETEKSLAVTEIKGVQSSSGQFLHKSLPSAHRKA